MMFKTPGIFVDCLVYISLGEKRATFFKMNSSLKTKMQNKQKYNIKIIDIVSKGYYKGKNNPSKAS